MSTRRQVNEYLACEFGFDESHPDQTATSAWPFEFTELGSLRSGTNVLAFAHEGEEFFVLDGEVLTYVERKGLSLEDLQLEETGSAWLASQRPLDLGASILGDSSIPSALERKSMLLGLASAATLDAEILTGTYLRTTRRSFGIVRDRQTGQQFVVGDGIEPIRCPLRQLPAWRELAVQMGVRTSGAGGGA